MGDLYRNKSKGGLEAGMAVLAGLPTHADCERRRNFLSREESLWEKKTHGRRNRYTTVTAVYSGRDSIRGRTSTGGKESKQDQKGAARQ